MLCTTDWTRSALTLEDPADLESAVRAAVIGGIACHPFATFYVFGARPAEAIVRCVNMVKGRPPEQTGSVMTTRDGFPSLFDWAQLPRQLDREQVLALVDALLEFGPFGFRGPARQGLPHYLTADDNGVRTVQVVMPGSACPSNHFFARTIDSITEPYLYGTSGNRSRRVTGAQDEPVHHRIAPLQTSFGKVPGFFMVRADDEAGLLMRFPRHAPMSASLLSFHKLGPSRERPAVVLERYGSLEMGDLLAVVDRLGLEVHVAPAAQRRLTAHAYGDAM